MQMLKLESLLILPPSWRSTFDLSIFLPHIEITTQESKNSILKKVQLTLGTLLCRAPFKQTNHGLVFGVWFKFTKLSDYLFASHPLTMEALIGPKLLKGAVDGQQQCGWRWKATLNSLLGGHDDNNDDEDESIDMSELKLNLKSSN